MKRFFLLVLVVFGLFGGVWLWGASLPGVASAERSALLDADVDAVFARLDDLSSYPAWSHLVPDGAQVELGEAVGSGAALAFRTQAGEVGSVEIVQSVAPDLVVLSAEGSEGIALTTFALATETDGTRVVLREEREVDGVFARVGARLRQGGREAALDASLDRLGQLSRQAPAG